MPNNNRISGPGKAVNVKTSRGALGNHEKKKDCYRQHPESVPLSGIPKDKKLPSIRLQSRAGRAEVKLP